MAFGTTLDRRAAGADRMPRPRSSPRTAGPRSTTSTRSDLVRRVTFTLTLVVRDEDPAARFDALDRLTSVAQNAIDGSDLGGAACPP